MNKEEKRRKKYSHCLKKTSIVMTAGDGKTKKEKRREKTTNRPH